MLMLEGIMSNDVGVLLVEVVLQIAINRLSV